MLQEQIAELANKLVKQAEEISQLRKAISNLTEAQTCSDKKPPTPAAPERSRRNPEPTKAHPSPPAKSKHIPLQWRVRTPSHTIPQNPLHRYSDRRLILDKAVPKELQMSGQKIINLINHKIAICSGKTLSTTSIDAIVYSRNGCPIAIASKGLTAEDLLPHTATLAKTCYSNPSGVVAHPDCQLFWVKLNGVPAKDQYERFIPTDQILKHLVTTQIFL